MSEAMVPFQQAQHRQDVVPIVPISFFSGHSTDQDEVKRSRIVDVGSDIHQTLRRPPQGHRGTERITGLHQKCCETDGRHEDLAESPSQNRHESTERDENYMSGFMKRQIDKVEE